MSNNNTKIVQKFLLFGFFIFLIAAYKFLIYFTPGEQLTEVFKIQNTFDKLKVAKQIDNNKGIDYALVNTLFPSKGYFVSMKDLCNNLISWANMSDLRKSFIGKKLRAPMDNYLNNYNDMVNNNLTMNGKSLKDNSLKCKDKNDLVYTGAY